MNDALQERDCFDGRFRIRGYLKSMFIQLGDAHLFRLLRRVLLSHRSQKTTNGISFGNDALKITQQTCSGDSTSYSGGILMIQINVSTRFRQIDPIVKETRMASISLTGNRSKSKLQLERNLLYPANFSRGVQRRYAYKIDKNGVI